MAKAFCYLNPCFLLFCRQSRVIESGFWRGNFPSYNTFSFHLNCQSFRERPWEKLWTTYFFGFIIVQSTRGKRQRSDTLRERIILRIVISNFPAIFQRHRVSQIFLPTWSFLFFSQKGLSYFYKYFSQEVWNILNGQHIYFSTRRNSKSLKGLRMFREKFVLPILEKAPSEPSCFQDKLGFFKDLGRPLLWILRWLKYLPSVKSNYFKHFEVFSHENACQYIVNNQGFSD